MLSPSERRKTPTGPAPERWLTFGGALFWNELTDAVANVTVARGPGTFPVVGTLPAGGVGRQRLNLDRVVVQGGELSATWSAATWLEVKAAYLRNQAEVREASVAPALAGKRLAEVPRDSASFSADWRPSPRLHFTPRARWIGRQFDDDENTLRLGEVVVLDVGASYSLTKQLELFLGIENLGNARIETARTADGVVSVGTPRFAFGGVRGRW